METNVNNTLVGAFVIILFTLIVLGIIWLSAGFSIDHYSTYMIYMQESVTGLSVDAPVEYNGVEVGTVRNIALNHKNPHLVELWLNIKAGTPITKGTTASLASRGITGIAYIALKDDSTDLTPLHAENGMPYPIIKTAPSLFLRLDTGLGKLTKSLTQLSNSFESVMDSENQHSFKQILLNLSQITETISNERQQVGIILDNTARATKQLSPVLQSSQGTMQILQTQTLPMTNQILINLNGISRNLLQITTDMKRNPAVLIRGKEPSPLGPGEK